MPFLTLNGVPIPTAKPSESGGTFDPMEIGERRRAFDGTYLRDTRAYKRQWKLRTKPLTELRAAQFMGLIRGDGLYLPVDGTVYGSNGLIPTTSNIVYRNGTAADGAPSYDQNGIRESLYGPSSICGEPAMTNPNILSAGIAQCTSTSGTSTTNGATVTLDTANFWEETHSLKIAGNGVTANPTCRMFSAVAGLQNTFYTCSFYVKGTGILSATFFDNNGGGVAVGAGPFTLSASSWQRVTLTLLSNNSTVASLYLDVTCTLGTAVWYMDGIQVQANIGFPTTFIVPGSSRTESDLKFTYSPIVGPAGYTINYWISKPVDVGAAAYHYDMHDAGITQRSFIYIPGSTPTSIAWGTTGSSTTDTITASGLSYSAAWHMVTSVLRYNPETGEALKSLYVDSVLKASSSPASTAYPAYGVPAVINVGCAYTAGGPSYGRLDDLQFLPYPVDSDVISGWYNLGQAIGALPQLLAAGDFVPDTSVTVEGQVNNVTYIGYKDSNGWKSNRQVIDFTLEEV